MTGSDEDSKEDRHLRIERELAAMEAVTGLAGLDLNSSRDLRVDPEDLLPQKERRQSLVGTSDFDKPMDEAEIERLSREYDYNHSQESGDRWKRTVDSANVKPQRRSSNGSVVVGIEAIPQRVLTNTSVSGKSTDRRSKSRVGGTLDDASFRSSVSQKSHSKNSTSEKSKSKTSSSKSKTSKRSSKTRGEKVASHSTSSRNVLGRTGKGYADIDQVKAMEDSANLEDVNLGNSDMHMSLKLKGNDVLQNLEKGRHVSRNREEQIEHARKFLWDEDIEEDDKCGLYKDVTGYTPSLGTRLYIGFRSRLTKMAELSRRWRYLIRESRIYSMLMGTCGMMLVVAGLSVLVTVYFMKKSAVKTPDQIRFNAISERIIAESVSSEHAVQTEGTPQFEALTWLAREDPAQLEPDDEFLMQRYALAVLYYSTHGTQQLLSSGKDEAWTDQTFWMSGHGYCSWYGVRCHHRIATSPQNTHYDDNGGVTFLNLTANNVHGQLPSEIFVACPDLRWLGLGDNSLSGPFPDEIHRLSDLEYFSAMNNKLTGSLPSFGLLTSLRFLHFDHNRFTGTLPSELALLTKLTELGLSNNNIGGTIATDFGRLSDLTGLYLNSNALVGALPVQLGNLGNLEDLRLSKNSFFGKIPAEFSGMTNLEVLYLDQNYLSGGIPTSLGSLARLTEMHLYHNDLTGSIPTELGRLERMRSVSLDNNKLVGPIPTEIGNMEELQTFYAFKNTLTSTLPTEIGHLFKMENFRVHKNALSGRLPTQFGRMTLLKDLYLYDNQFTGEVNMFLGNLSNLNVLRIHENQLEGDIPSQVCALPDLSEFIADCGNSAPSLTCSCCSECI